MRRGMRHAHSLGNKDPIFHKIFPILLEQMQDAYPELLRAKDLIYNTLLDEESKFKQTIDNGLKILEEEIKNTTNNIFNGEIAFKLYDTYGFPLDLTQDYLKNNNIIVDVVQFNKKMQLQKERARKSWKGTGDLEDKEILFQIAENLETTDFLGYENVTSEGIIKKIICDNKKVTKLYANEEGGIILNQTPFYGESGGQIGDSGTISNDSFIFEVNNTIKIFGTYFLHLGKLIKGACNLNDEVIAEIDIQRRELTKNNHSATHLLHSSLRIILGKHVTQKWSLVSFDRFRFDFSYPKSIDETDVKKIENIVNKIIKQNNKVLISIMSHKKAVGMGAMALFGEKYENEVRVVTMGKNDNKSNFSMELCGGTHVKNTGDINDIKIVKQSPVAAGIRRIEALCGNDLLNYLNEEKKVLTLKEKEKENKEERKGLDEKKRKVSLSDPSKNIIEEGTHNSIKYYFRTIIEFPPNELPKLLDKCKIEIQNGVVAIFSVYEKNIFIVVGVTDDITKRISAVDIAKKLSKVLGGSGGGGRPDFARAGGGNNKSNIPKACNAIKELIKSC